MTTVAMWSGPRNISTAMMYSFGNRADTTCWDEPFYAFSLVHHGNDHPMRDEIITANEHDFGKLVARCLARPATPHAYQKHMTHHMLPGYDRQWILALTNAFLIRDPARVLESYVKRWSDVTLRDIGFVEQVEIFDMVAGRLGQAPPVVDAEDVLADSRGVLSKLCAACGLPFDEAMLAWPAGHKPFDGNWASHWYETVWKSTGFGKPKHKEPELPPALRRIADAARPYYERMRPFRLI